MKVKIKGEIAENIAQRFLEKKGFKLLYKNLKLKNFGEIDLVMKKGNLVNFVEVKSLNSKNFSPEIHFSKRKKMKLLKLIEFFTNKFSLENFVFSLVVIDFYQKKIRYYENL